MPAVLASVCERGTRNSSLSVCFSMSGSAPPSEACHLYPLRRSIVRQSRPFASKQGKGEDGRSGAVVQGTQPSVFPQNSNWAAPRIPNFDQPTPLLPVKHRVWSGLVCSSPWPGLLPHKDAVGLRIVPLCSPFLFLPDHHFDRPSRVPWPIADPSVGDPQPRTSSAARDTISLLPGY